MSRPSHALSTIQPDLTASILARTSGPACGRLRELAFGFVDQALSTEDRELVSLHLERCRPCQALVAGLEEASHALPGFAVVDPGPAFTASVMEVIRSPLPPIHPPPDRFLAGWAKLMRRPRAAMEAAYLATAAGFILTQSPLPGSADLAGSAFISLARTEGRAAIARVAARGQGLSRSTLAASPDRILRSRESAWTTFRTRFTRPLERSWKRLAKAVHATWTWLWPQRSTAAPPATEPQKAPPRSAL